MSETVKKLEQEFAEWLGVPGAVATGYGRGAIWLAVKLVLEGRPGAQVLVPDFVCAQVPEAVRRAGGVPVCFPVQRDLTVREADLEAAVTPQTRAAVLVHYYGRVLPGIRPLAEMCRRREIVLIEDCALALGARAAGRLAGTFGDLAAFSFTKSDWCYGGGMVVAREPGSVERLRQLREENCRAAARLAFCYGLLRRVDFAANRPGYSRVAEHVGRWLERGLALLEPSLRGNFFDAGRFDARMPGFAAHRALRILSELDATIARRRAAHAAVDHAIHTSIPGAADVLRPFPSREHPQPGDTGAFVLYEATDGRAADWVARADAVGLTIRPTWPTYQQAAGLGASSRWWQGRLLVSEVAG